MATKNISITESSYKRLAALRIRENESFSEVINRVAKKRKLSTVIDLFSNEEGMSFKRNLEKVRKARAEADKKRLERIKRGK
jgi:predicted CopG family antitoxin